MFRHRMCYCFGFGVTKSITFFTKVKSPLCVSVWDGSTLASQIRQNMSEFPSIQGLFRDECDQRDTVVPSFACSRPKNGQEQASTAKSIFRFTRTRIPANLSNTRIWWNWQTRYFEVVVPQGIQVQVLLSAPTFFRGFG